MKAPRASSAVVLMPRLVVQSKDERRRRAYEAEQRRLRWRAHAEAKAELDWERYGKYDMLHEVLKSATSAPQLQVLHVWSYFKCIK